MEHFGVSRDKNVTAKNHGCKKDREICKITRKTIPKVHGSWTVIMQKKTFTLLNRNFPLFGDSRDFEYACMPFFFILERARFLEVGTISREEKMNLSIPLNTRRSVGSESNAMFIY